MGDFAERLVIFAGLLPVPGVHSRCGLHARAITKSWIRIVLMMLQSLTCTFFLM